MTQLAEIIGMRCKQIIELRYMAGLTNPETAEGLKGRYATIERKWNFAWAWLRRELQPGGAGQGAVE